MYFCMMFYIYVILWRVCDLLIHMCIGIYNYVLHIKYVVYYIITAAFKWLLIWVSGPSGSTHMGRVTVPTRKTQYPSSKAIPIKSC